MGEDELTSIEITKGTRRRLRVWKAEREMTYDEAINHLLDQAEADDHD